MPYKSNIILEIDPKFCKGCEICISICRKNILKLSDDLNHLGFHYAVITNAQQCNGCALCATMCPDVAIQLWKDIRT